MASLHNFKNNKYQPSTIQQIGQKVKNAAEFIAMAKGAWDIGRTIYDTGRAIAPVAGAIATACFNIKHSLIYTLLY
jgi:malate/lactate dehydrogenase